MTSDFSHYRRKRQSKTLYTTTKYTLLTILYYFTNYILLIRLQEFSAITKNFTVQSLSPIC